MPLRYSLKTGRDIMAVFKCFSLNGLAICLIFSKFCCFTFSGATIRHPCVGSVFTFDVLIDAVGTSKAGNQVLTLGKVCRKRSAVSKSRVLLKGIERISQHKVQSLIYS